MRIRKYILAALLGALCLSAAAQSRRDIAALDSLAAVSDSAAVRGLILLKAMLMRRMYCFDEAMQLYFILSQQRPEDLGYQVRYMYLLGRAKAYSSVIAQGRELLKRDTLLQALTLVGDAFNNMEQADSAMRYYNAALLRQPHNASSR